MDIKRILKKHRYMLVVIPLVLASCSKETGQEADTTQSSVIESSVAESPIADTAAETTTVPADAEAETAAAESADAQAGDTSAEAQSSDNFIDIAENGLYKLTEGQTYTYDLDGDGSAESIRYETSAKDEYYELAEIYINDILLYSDKDSYGFNFAIFLTDLDREDSRLELCLYAEVESDTVQALTFLRYDNDDITELGNLANKKVLDGAGSYNRGYLSEVNDDGTIVITMDTPIYGAMFGCYYVPVSFRLDGGKIREIVQDEYTFSSYGAEHWRGYVVNSSFTAMTEPDGVEEAFTAEAGDVMEFNGICIYDGDLYGRVTNADGQSGWLVDLDGLFPGEEGAYFVEVPAWG